MSSFTSYAKQAFDNCSTLAEYSQSPGIVDRQYLTPEHKQANQLVAELMQQAGMKTWQDEAGNQWGRYTSKVRNAKTFVIGSHLDTVPNGGKYDGILGVTLPLQYVKYCFDNKKELSFHLEIVGFADEEGSRFGTTLLGSRAVAGTWQDKWANLKDKQNTSLAEAMRSFGLDVNQVHSAARQSNQMLGFLEVHIEQGPVLEAKDLPVGIVSGIAGATRLSVEVKGFAGHAGTVPMNMRNDALAASSEMILEVEKIATKHNIVATVGKIENAPNAVNVISGDCAFSLDVRSQDDSLRAQALSDILTRFEQISESRKVKINTLKTHEASAVICDENLTAGLEKAVKSQSITPFTLASGAGHDAMAIADLCAVSMLFMRCEKGISHHPAESVTTEDIGSTLSVLNAFIEALDDSLKQAT